MKKYLAFLTALISLCLLSSCARQPQNVQQTMEESVATSITEHTDETTETSVPVTEKAAETTPSGIQLKVLDNSGTMVRFRDILEVKLNYAYGWDVSGDNSYYKIGEFSEINGLDLIQVYSTYFNRFSSWVNNANGYTLTSKEPFGSIELDGIVEKVDDIWVFHIIMNDGDQYFPEVAVFSEDRLDQLKSKCKITLDGEEITVQPIKIVLTNDEMLKELDEVNKTIFKAKIALAGIFVSSNAQQGADDYATITSAKAYITDILSVS